MKSIKEINTSSPEGKMLWAALIVLTQSPDVLILGQNVRGSNTEPDVMIQKLNDFVEELKQDPQMFEYKYDHLKELPGAIAILVNSLRGDKTEGSYYYSWQANIAMAFVDAYEQSDIDRDSIKTIANKAAKQFLDNLITTS